MNQGKDNSYLFTIDLLIQGPDRAAAVDFITKILADPRILDYKIQKGLDVGKWVDAVYQQMQKGLPLSQEKYQSSAKADEHPSAASSHSAKPSGLAAKSSDPVSDNKDIIELLEHYKAKGTLVRLKILKGKGIHLSIPCRILNYDPSTHNVSVYHVDEKKVYLFHINEIEDITQ